jgi:hypothetical protein
VNVGTYVLFLMVNALAVVLTIPVVVKDWKGGWRPVMGPVFCLGRSYRIH